MKLIQASKKAMLPLLASLAFMMPLKEGLAQFSNTPIYASTRAAGRDIDLWKRTPLLFTIYGTTGPGSQDVGGELSGAWKGEKWQAGAMASLDFLDRNDNSQYFEGYDLRDHYQLQVGAGTQILDGLSLNASIRGEIASWMNLSGYANFSYGYELGACLEASDWAIRAGVQKPTPYKREADSSVAPRPPGPNWHPPLHVAFEFRPTKTLALDARWVDMPNGIDTVYAGVSYRIDALFGDRWSWLLDADLATTTREAQDNPIDRLRLSVGRGNEDIIFRLWREKPFWGDPQFGISLQGRLL